MNTSKRVAVSVLAAAIFFFLGALFWPFVVNNILRPTALVIWLLLRILILSIHQQYVWYALNFAAFIFLFRRFPRQHSQVQPDVYREENATTVNIGYWRGLFVYSGQNVHNEKTLKRELTYLLTSLYASKQHTANDFHIQDALRQGRIPLPDKIRTFLFSQDLPVSGGAFKKIFQSIRKTLQRWKRQWTGQEKTEHYQMIEEVLTFMEASLEINNDDGTLSRN